MSSTINTIASFQTTLNSRRSIAGLTADIQKASNEVSTGLYDDVYDQLGMRSAQTIALRAKMNSLDSYVTNNTILDGKMETMDETLSTISDALAGVMDLATANADSSSGGASALQAQAQSALGVILAALNTSYAGEYLFSGTSTGTAPMQDLDTVNTASGLSPQGVIDSILGSGPTTTADVTTMIAALDDVFGSTTEGTATNYEETFFNGTDLTTGGTDNARVTASIGDGQVLSYGVQANDSGFTAMIKGLMMLSSVDVSTIEDPDTYSAYMKEVLSSLDTATTSMNATRTNLGSQRAMLESVTDRQSDLSDVYNNRIMTVEGVDSYEAATRLSALQTQLEATYSVTTTIAQLSILNYL